MDTAPGSARAHVTAVLREWKASSDTAADAATIVTELTTNAVETTRKHGLYVPISLWMLGDRASAVFLVWDATDATPVLRDATSDAEHGRGLQMVNGLSERWGFYRPDEHPFGKVVWAAIHKPEG
ncbi:ATP-binding protein [Trebonia sp.]|uniref:ATP-binding protein n=1 Tax=Trebonia sp. TaxID=2767075 RepID=UPI00260BD4BA|nr:ATP-binding protein [Trebonia sp.]